MIDAAVPRGQESKRPAAHNPRVCVRTPLPQRKATMTSTIRLARNAGNVVREVTKPQPLRLLSVREAASYAKVSTQTVRRWIKAGHLKVYRAGRQLRIDEADLISFLSSGKAR
jgi:excisionase family DNA binding protein